MIEAKWFKSILYIVYTIGCVFSGCVIYYAAKNGMLYTGLLHQVKVKLLILGIPAILCIIIDEIYHSHDMFEAFAWETSIGWPVFCLLVGHLVLRGDKQAIAVFGLSIPASVIYILMYALSLVVTWLAGLLAIWTGEDQRPKRRGARTHSDNTHTPPVSKPRCGAFGFPEEMGPNHLPDNLKGPDY